MSSSIDRWFAMNDHAPKRIPMDPIAGPLRVAKTTTFNDLLEHRPAGERWAVLVNEYGLVGLDAAMTECSDQLGGRPGVQVREVAGDCICCSAGLMFEMSLVPLLQRRPDRLMIELAWFAAFSEILDTLEREGIRESVHVRSVVCLLEPGRLAEDLLREEDRDQAERRGRRRPAHQSQRPRYRTTAPGVQRLGDRLV